MSAGAGTMADVAVLITALSVAVSRVLYGFARARKPPARGGGQIYTGDPATGYRLVRTDKAAGHPLEHNPDYWAPEDESALDPEGVIDA